ncbi:hypothetical protein NDA18_001536 [Ustilago nuda]|nr:hypothetical protein NDA18_001536 [Ustilago nuda]
MLNVAILPADPTRTCLSIRNLTSSLLSPSSSPSSSPLSPHLTIHASLTPSVTTLIWLPNIKQANTSLELSTLLSSPAGGSINFIQMPMTGIDDFIALIRSTSQKITWSCAKGCCATLVAEHALALALSLLRGLSKTGCMTSCQVASLSGKSVVVIGNGGVGKQINRFLLPFACQVTMTDSITTKAQLLQLLQRVSLVFIACPLTEATKGMFAHEALSAMRSDAVLINVARGEIVNTGALINAVKHGNLNAAGLDVITFTQGKQGEKEKEELDKLVKQGKLLITPHAAIPHHMIEALLGERIRHNLEVLATGKGELMGVVDPNKGY